VLKKKRERNVNDNDVTLLGIQTPLDLE